MTVQYMTDICSFYSSTVHKIMAMIKLYCVNKTHTHSEPKANHEIRNFYDIDTNKQNFTSQVNHVSSICLHTSYVTLYSVNKRIRAAHYVQWRVVMLPDSRAWNDAIGHDINLLMLFATKLQFYCNAIVKHLSCDPPSQWAIKTMFSDAIMTLSRPLSYQNKSVWISNLTAWQCLSKTPVCMTISELDTRLYNNVWARHPTVWQCLSQIPVCVTMSQSVTCPCRMTLTL